MSDDFELREEYDFSGGVRGRFYRPKKRATTIRLDDDILLYFKKKAGERKVAMEEILRSARARDIVDVVDIAEECRRARPPREAGSGSSAGK